VLRLIKRLVFRLIYKVYLWSSSCSGESFLGSRSIEYPFVIEELRKSSIPEDSKVLLVGCAGDPLSTILPALGYETYGLDVKHVAIKYPKFHFIRGDIRKTEFPDNYFNVVVAVSTIEHVGMLEGDYEGDKKAIREMLRILKMNGILLMTLPIASTFRVSSTERVYDIRMLNSLLAELNIRYNLLFYKRDEDGYWNRCSSNELYTSNISEAVVLVKAVKMR